MTAGVPGLGLGGLFALFAALCLPLLTPRRRGYGRLFGMATVIVAAALLAWKGVSWLYSTITTPDAAGHPATLALSWGQMFGVPIIVVSLAMLTALLLTGEILYRVLGVRPTPMPPPIPEPAAPAD